jgi:hypothetical protein
MRARTVAAAASVVLAIAASTVWLVAPAYSSVTVRASATASARMTEVHRTLAAVNGWRVVWFLAIPVVAAGLGLAVRRRWALIPAATLLWLFVLATGFSIGLFYVPAAGAMIVAAALETTAKPRAR